MRLTTPTGSVILASGNLNTSLWGGGVGGFNGAAPEVPFAVDVSQFTGKPVTLHFEVRDVGDTLVASGLAISDVQLKPTNELLTVPGGVLKGSATVKGQYGSVVKFVVTNTNPLRLTDIRITDNSPAAAAVDGYYGDSKATHLLPGQTTVVTFAQFGEEPMYWDFRIESNYDDSTVTYSLKTTWIDGMPPRPCY